MKIQASDIEVLRAAIAPLDTPAARAQYIAGDFPRAEAVQDLDKRYRWDLLWAAMPSAEVCTLMDRNAAHDAHMDTALRSIVAPLETKAHAVALGGADDIDCAQCGARVDALAVFPGGICLDCHAKSPSGRHMPTSDELVAMWGGSARR